MSARPKPAGGDWHKQLRLDMQFAEKVLLDTGEVTAQFVVHSADAIRIIITPWRSDDEKAAYRQLVRMFCIAHDAIACSAIGEAWTTTAWPMKPMMPSRPVPRPCCRATARRAGRSSWCTWPIAMLPPASVG